MKTTHTTIHHRTSVASVNSSSSSPAGEPEPPSYAECVSGTEGRRPPAYGDTTSSTSLPTNPFVGLVNQINLGQMIVWLSRPSTLKSRKPGHCQIQAKVTATIRTCYGEDDTLFERAVLIQNYLEAQISRLIAEFQAVAKASGHTLRSGDLISLVHEALEPIYASISEYNLTYGLKLVICESKQASRRAAKTGGSLARPGCPLYDNRTLDEVVEGLVISREWQVKEAVENVLSKHPEHGRRRGRSV
ncbi:hypothetical protein L198_04723 [Cryptococcus wingfieldii CBS 7118]|uniref:Uncharacterized protein n=1 Tax=Cryptococcus wingfieldii CBS 7118 TaxID=1295528 RepID=A0A1E3J3A7_9TREE|nr:hypothetical protein L198_04723 [Cryptococcus wingfieldii CBS 7118]ODN95327.1 hypothetical protein L198_04723 [Cryptococcus wingfieldii CBS 7118]